MKTAVSKENSLSLLHIVFSLFFLEDKGTRKSEVLNSLIMKITANENDINDILQTFR